MPQWKQPGKKIKPLSERSLRTFKPIQCLEQSYSYEKQVQVLLFLEKHRIPDDGMKAGWPTKTEQPRKNNSSHDIPGYQSPTFREASEFFKIPVTTLQVLRITVTVAR
jgi:hypothetical protein